MSEVTARPKLREGALEGFERPAAVERSPRIVPLHRYSFSQGLDAEVTGPDEVPA